MNWNINIISKHCGDLSQLCFLVIIIMISTSQCNEISNDWAVEIEGGETEAKSIAKYHNMEYLGKVGNIENVYHFHKKESTESRFKRSIVNHTKNLMSHKKVKWVQHQKPLKRSKRGFSKISKKHLLDLLKEKRDEVQSMFNDPLWKNQWYIYDTRSSSIEHKSDMHILPVWKMNITGRNVKVSILDDGLEHTHPDLARNYDPQSSYDLNDNDDDPTPDLRVGTSNEHGTRCASEISMVENNEVCGVGIAFNAKIGGIRMLDGSVTDLIEAKSLGFRNDHIDIYSASWGPLDDGKSMGKPGILALKALENGAKHGRNGKGNLFVWASGNGGYFEDSCSCDGYVASRFTISVSSVTPRDSIPVFDESCSSLMATTYSAGSSESKDSRLVTADVNGGCSNLHSGTSASAPMAAGILALTLETNPNLTWRDVKHLLAWTSQYSSLKSVEGWNENNAGFKVSDKFGFGLIDAQSLVQHAKLWKTVPEEKNCSISLQVDKGVSSKRPYKLTIPVSKCQDVKFIEHIIIRTTMSYSKRGALKISLCSPNSQFNTTLLYPRKYDNTDEGIIDWPFNSVQQWGETPNGDWIMYFEDVRNVTDSDKPRFGLIKDIELTFYGTHERPKYLTEFKRNGRRQYDENYNDVFKNKKRWL